MYPVIDRRLNVTVFSHDNNSLEIPLTSLDLRMVSGYVLEETFASVSGFILEGHFYGTVFLKVRFCKCGLFLPDFFAILAQKYKGLE